jgi:lipopolysaccharide/colanic/teichoic acid biosynthesis glycosyltransferase
VVKRTVDTVGASVGLVLLSPLLAATAVAVKLTSRGPAFYKQTREGMGGRPFTIYKIRTMEMDAESRQTELRHHSHRDGPAFKIKDDPRVTRVGQFLRSTCIDELPQLINVIKGDMSLVGPRPLPWHESRACSHWHRRRLDVPPGLTCYWQVDKASAETFDDWMRMDLRYVDRHGLWRDLRLIAKTLLVPFAGRGSN